MRKRTMQICGAAALAWAVAGTPLMTRAADAPAATPPATTAPDAPPPGRDRAPRATPQGGERQARITRGFSMDQQQRELFREATQKDSERLRQLNRDLQSAQKALATVITAEKYDEKAVREKAEAAAKIQTEITVLRGKAFSTVAPTLTAEQRQQLDSSPFALNMILGGMPAGGATMGAARGDAPPMVDRRRPAGEEGERPRRRQGDSPAAPPPPQ